MSNLNEIELQHLRHLIERQDINYKKFLNYSDYAVDPQIKQIFNKAAQDTLSVKQNLVSFLS